MRFAITSLIPALMALASLSAQAYEPPQSPTKNAFGRAIGICAPYINGNKSPGLVSESDYLEYIDLRDQSLAVDPKLPEWDVAYLGKVPKEYYPKCEKLMADYVAGVDADKKPTLLTSCEHNVNARLGSIIDTYYPDFQKKGASSSPLFFPRKDLEVARFYMYKKDGWYSTGGCATNDQYKPAFAPLKEKFAQAEALVKKMEEAKGVRFERVDRKGTAHNLIFVDSKTGKQVSQQIANN